MKFLRGVTLLFLVGLAACQPQKRPVTIMDGDRLHTLEATTQTPRELLNQAGITLLPHERVLFNGISFPADQQLPYTQSIQLQVRHGSELTLVTPQGQGVFYTSAWTVGEALLEAGVILGARDFLDPPAETPITQPLTVTFRPARALNIFSGGRMFQTHSAKSTVGEALAEAGIPLVGADYASPSEDSALPGDGNIRVTRVHEIIQVDLASLSFEQEIIHDASLPLGQEEIVQPGVKGLAMTRARIRYEDGAETRRMTEEQVVLQAPQKQIVKSGSQIVTANINGLEYWLKTEMYATVYSPCASGTGGCSYGTASGARAGYGIVAVDTSSYPYLAGMQVYIPGYGTATIGDTGGGSIIEKNTGIPRAKWIDLGFDDGKIVNMTGWVTVYFLAPAPPEIPAILK